MVYGAFRNLRQVSTFLIQTPPDSLGSCHPLADGHSRKPLRHNTVTYFGGRTKEARRLELVGGSIPPGGSAFFLERDDRVTLEALIHAGATKPTGPDARHNASAAVLARTVIVSPAPGSLAKTRLSPGCTGTLTSGPSDSDNVIEPSLLAR
jgi:hypothetical protein